MKKIHPPLGESQTRVKFALFPRRLFKSYNTTISEGWVWLERFTQTKQYRKYTYFDGLSGTDDIGWVVISQMEYGK